MEITMLSQTRNGNCGQTAVAMLSGKSIAEVEKIYGHGHVTFPHEHIQAVSKLGFQPDPNGFVTYKKGDALPALALVRICFVKRSGGKLSTTGKVKRTGHLVLLVNGMFYDPCGAMYSVESLALNRAKVINMVLALTKI